MKSFIHELVTRKLETLRVMVLLVLCGVAACLLMEDTALPADAAAGPLSGLTVALDPGHGGYDGGARAHDSGRWEKELTLQIALEIEEALMERGAQVILTRREDVCLADGDTATKARKRADLQRRMDIAQEGGADVFLSIHLNEYRSRAESGPQVFYQQGGEAGKALAEQLQKSLVAALRPPKERVAMAGDYYVLRGKLPSALVECGFLSNAQEEKLLMDRAYQRRIGQAIADGLENYLTGL